MSAKEKILLITGASSDVGIALLPEIYSRYEYLYLQYRTMNDSLKRLIEDIGAEGKVLPIRCDLQETTQVEEMIKDIIDHGRIPNNIVHLASPKPNNGYFHTKCSKDFDAGWEISVKSIILLLQKFLPMMTKEHYGRVLFMLSSYTCGTLPKFQTEYITSKYALLGLMKSLSEEYKNKGITFNGVSPDMMETKFLSDIPHLIVETYAEKKATGRNLTVEEIIPIIKYILSDDSSSMTGQNICIGEG